MSQGPDAFPATEKIPRENPSFSEEFGNALEYAWGPLLVSLVFSFALASFDAAHEALLAAVENFWRDIPGQIAGGATILAFLFLPSILHQATKYALDTTRYFGDHNMQIERILLTWVGRFPLVAAAIAILFILFGQDPTTFFARMTLSVLLVVLLFFIAAGFKVFLPPGMLQSYAQRRSARPPSLIRRIFRPLVAMYLVVERFCSRHQKAASWISIALLAGMAIFPGVAIWLGPIAVTVLFVSVLAIVLAGLTRLSTRLSYGQLPLILTVIGFVIAASGQAGSLLFLAATAIYCFAVFYYPGKTTRTERYVGATILFLAALIAVWGYLRRDECPALAGCNVVAGVQPATPPTQLSTAFDAWLQARPAGETGDPIRLIAAEGGGLFAAYYTAMYLAKSTDMYGDRYARSIFAISGVSGGSVGAATYWAIRKSGICDRADATPDCHQQQVRLILGRDYLSPVLARMYTWDLLDTVVPLSSLDPSLRLERGRQLELALIRNARVLDDDDPDLAGAMADSWSPTAQVPVLLLNATHVATGDRVILSPFAGFDVDQQYPLPLRLNLAEGRDLSVAAAAFISARFPVVTAPARIVIDGRSRQYVDGGYFDNSGIETIHDLLRRLPNDVVPQTRVIALTTVQPGERVAASDCTFPGAAPADAREAMQGLVGAPLATFMGTRRAHQEITWNRAQDYWAGRTAAERGAQVEAVSRLPLALYGLNYTVSWYLDQSTFCGIERNLNTKLRCDSQGNPSLTSPLSLPSNSCVE